MADLQTHVISEEIKRTVKFLSALSHGPPFLTEKWVKDSVKRGKILRELSSSTITA